MIIPHRPRLAEHARLRRVRATRDDGTTEESIVLHDARGGPTLKLEARVGELLLHADGTRDVDGIALSASRAGVYRDVGELRALLEGLAGRGLLAEGTDSPIVAAPLPATPGDRPIRRLEFTLICSGNGVCCTQYDAYAFSDLEAARARSLAPDVLGAAHAKLFLPLEGSTPRGTLVVTTTDGGCAYLAADGGCSLHAKGGAEGKPLSCRLYPVTLFDDGVSIRASVRPECACVFDSVGRTDGAPLLDETIRCANDLRGGAIVRVLPEQLPVTRTRALPRAIWAEISADLSSCVPTHDVAATCWALADALTRETIDVNRARGAFEAKSLPEGARRWLSALAAHARSSAEVAAQWRSPRDRVRRGRALVAHVARALVEASGFPRATSADDERFHLRAGLFGHHLAERLPLVDALRDRAVRLLLARAIDTEPHPLALVETLARAHALDAYVSQCETT